MTLRWKFDLNPTLLLGLVARGAAGDGSAAISTDWRRGAVERTDLDRFLFEPGDIVVAVGQDGRCGWQVVGARHGRRTVGRLPV